MSLLSIFSPQVDDEPAEQPIVEQTPPSGGQRGIETRKRFAVAFATPATAAEAAPGLGMTHVSCLIQLYRYEKRGFVVRVGEREQPEQGSNPILWKWIEVFTQG